uniref:Serine hydrolase domain-containing protein n=1 Tax=Peronospora matthiolae TaxID=2874970 RepID=A0AAV1T0W6_9STRA
MATRPIRVLCLHGWRTNSRVLESQTSALRQAFGSRAEFTFVNAPWPASGPVPELVRLFYGPSGPFYQWWDAQKHSDTTSSRWTYSGFQRSLDQLTSEIDALGSVDAVLGFSQGAAMATLLTAQYLSKASRGSLVPWKVCVLVAGFDPETPETLELLLDGGAYSSVDGTLDIPSVHLVGRRDAVVTALRSKKLEQRFTSTRRIRFEHDGGHEFPSGVKCRQLYKDIAQEVLSITGQAWK